MLLYYIFVANIVGHGEGCDEVSYVCAHSHHATYQRIRESECSIEDHIRIGEADRNASSIPPHTRRQVRC
ncbi:hypothetical protein DSECCO2_649530 [anaerobic digester metagenome]